MSPVITLPDTLSEWSWRSRLLNPYYEDVGKESADWIASFGVFDSKIQSIFDKCKFSKICLDSFFGSQHDANIYFRFAGRISLSIVR
jgi:hypothetical protein